MPSPPRRTGTPYYSTETGAFIVKPLYSIAPDTAQNVAPSLDVLNDTIIDYARNRDMFLRKSDGNPEASQAMQRDLFRFFLGSCAGFLIAGFTLTDWINNKMSATDWVRVGAGVGTIGACVVGAGVRYAQYRWVDNTAHCKKLAQEYDLMIYDLTHAHPNFRDEKGKPLRMHRFNETPRLYDEAKRDGKSFKRVLGLAPHDGI